MTIAKINGYPAIEPQLDRIPDFLKTKRCAVWIAEPRSGYKNKYNKAPRHPVTGNKIGADKPEMFGTYAQAVAALETGEYSGIGILLTGEGMVGVDIDDYEATFTAQKEVKAWVLEARKAGAYCELSPSREGLRLFMRGKLPGKGRKAGQLEIYDNARFLTITGKCDKKSGGELIDGQHFVDSFLTLFPPEITPAKAVPTGNLAADKATVDALCIRAEEKRPALWAGYWEEHLSEYASQSEADMALVGAITREAVKAGVDTDALADTVEQVFIRSALYREEKLRAVQSYTIPKAINEALAGREQAVQVVQDTSGAEFANAEPGDIMAGGLYAKVMRGKLLHVAQAGLWLRWDGMRWGWCSCGEEMAAAKLVANKALDWATALIKADSDKHRKRMGFALQLQNLKRLEAMVKLAKSEEGMTIGHMTDLDSDQWLLGVRNGVVNLRTGGLLAPDPAMLITRQAAAEYHREAQCPRWLAFLDSVFSGDQETIAFIQRACGYSLTGVTTEEVLFICYGHGANGKSVFGNILGNILGDYSQVAPPSLLTVRRDGDSGPRNDIARLCGARLIQINELQQGDRLDEQIVKMLAGREMLSARYLHKEFFDFWPTAKPWLRTNHRPVVTGEDDGIWRRLLLIPFARKFNEDERNPNLEQQLLEERDGILAWMVSGCLDWKRSGGLKPSPLIRRESATYRKESDLLGEFLDERAVMGANERVEQTKLFAVWRDWCESNGVRYGSKKSFTRKLDERGFKEARSNGERLYTGLSLNTKPGGM